MIKNSNDLVAKIDCLDFSVQASLLKDHIELYNVYWKGVAYLMISLLFCLTSVVVYLSSFSFLPFFVLWVISLVFWFYSYYLLFKKFNFMKKSFNKVLSQYFGDVK